MSKKGSQKRRRLFRLWEADPHCHWCRRPTILIFRPGGEIHNLLQTKYRVPDDQATLDHLHDRVLHQDGRPRLAQGIETTVLACSKCNNERSNGTVNSSRTTIPKEAVWERSGAFPVGHPKNPKKKWTFTYCGHRRVVYAASPESAVAIATRIYGEGIQLTENEE